MLQTVTNNELILLKPEFMILASITIDIHKQGVDFWCQEKDKLTDEQRKRFEALKKAVERLLKDQAVQLELV